MPNGDLISMPIPSAADADTYADLFYGGKSYAQILRELKPSFAKRKCHLDPDIDQNRRKKSVRGWKPAFGQIGTSSAHLVNSIGVGPGDLFLFFGKFHRVECFEGRYRFVHRSGDFYRDHDLHVIWGYLQVDEVIRDADRICCEYPWHPHAEEWRLSRQSNLLIIPRRHLSFAKSRPGCGLLPFSKERVLTKENTATWKCNPVYMPSSIVGNRKNLAGRAGVFYSGIWQELGLKESAVVSRWAREIVLAK